MKKNGFISTSLIYTFFVLFLLLMLFLINSYSSKRFLLDRYKYDVKNKMLEDSAADINIYFMVYDEDSKEYELRYEIPEKSEGYHFDIELSYCKKTPKSNIGYYLTENEIKVSGIKQKDFCYIYFN